MVWIFKQINTETGEIKDVEPGTKVINPKTVEYLKKTIEIDSKFLKIFTLNDDILFKMLTDKKGKLDTNSISLMRYLYKFISYETGVLLHTNQKPLTVKYIIDNLGISQASIYRSLKVLKDKGIIAKGKHEGKQCYIFNPFLVSNGKRIEDRVNFTNSEFADNLKDK